MNMKRYLTPQSHALKSVHRFNTVKLEIKFLFLEYVWHHVVQVPHVMLLGWLANRLLFIYVS